MRVGGLNGTAAAPAQAPRRHVRAGRTGWTIATTTAALVVCLLAAGASRAATVTISPLDGTRDASPQTQISFLGAAANQIHAISVVGSSSGEHSGRVEGYASAVGASFLPSHPFAAGEHVSVRATIGHATATSSFTVARLDAYDYTSTTRSPQAPVAPAPGQNFVSAPTLQPPAVSIDYDSPEAAPGDIFMTFAHGAGQSGPMIVNGAGQLVWFTPVPKGMTATDLQVESYEGKPALVWWQGYIPSLGIGFGTDEIYGSNYRPLARVNAGNGYKADLHDIQITPKGSAFITSNTLVHTSLASGGGPREGVLIDSVLQEIDIKTGLVMFEWHAFGHVDLSESYSDPHVSSTQPWDWFHLNSISPGPDGNLLISSRNTSALYDVSTADGRVLWRIGGKNPTFKMGAGTGMAYQHDARWQPDHTITVFDDGAVPKKHSQSRAIRLAIDWAHLTVHLVAREVRTPPLLTGSQGNDQILPNGDSFVGWGEVPYFTEFNPTGQMVLDGRMPYPAQSYRAYKFPWSGTPSTSPAIAVKASGAGTDTVYASWNGATGVSAWRVLAGSSSKSLIGVAGVPDSGFETAIPVQTTATHFAVQALDGSGRVLATSTIVSAG
ncbi:MAG: arylsulfotransferase family protein [Solirubrobacteraceae bacterium]